MLCSVHYRFICQHQYRLNWIRWPFFVAAGKISSQNVRRASTNTTTTTTNKNPPQSETSLPYYYCILLCIYCMCSVHIHVRLTMHPFCSYKMALSAMEQSTCEKLIGSPKLTERCRKKRTPTKYNFGR